MVNKEYPVIDMKATGNNLRRLRKAHKYRILEVCDYMGGITHQAVYKWERGASVPSTDNLFALCRLFGVHMDEILVEEGMAG